MKSYFADPTLRLMLFDLRDVLTTSPENPDDDDETGDTPIIGN